MSSPALTTPAEPAPPPDRPVFLDVARCHLAVLSGADKGREVLVTGDVCRVGKAPDNHLVLDDETVSRYHFELVREPRGWLLRDAGSTNGTQLDGAEIREAFLKTLSVVTAGTVQLRVRTWAERIERTPSTSDHFGDALGDARPMRELFGVLERLAPSETSVLLLGEPGTGRELLARALHGRGPRAGRAFVKIDCAQAPPVLEGELFGSERAGGAVGRFGALEAASGGTVFLAEVGALPIDLQPRLQRALAERQVRRAGSARPARIDVRVVASARPDLGLDVERRRFSRDHVPRLVRHFVTRSAREGAAVELPESIVAALGQHDWPGNLPELAAVALRAAGGAGVPFGAGGPSGAFAPGTTFKDEKDRWEAEFERTYVKWLLSRAGGNITQAARDASMDRKYLHKLMRKHGLGKGS